jgi:hypothetical protein
VVAIEHHTEASLQTLWDKAVADFESAKARAEALKTALGKQ